MGPKWAGFVGGATLADKLRGSDVLFPVLVFLLFFNGEANFPFPPEDSLFLANLLPASPDDSII